MSKHNAISRKTSGCGRPPLDVSVLNMTADLYRKTGSTSEVAAFLGITRTAVCWRLRRVGIKPKSPRRDLKSAGSTSAVWSPADIYSPEA